MKRRSPWPDGLKKNGKKIEFTNKTGPPSFNFHVERRLRPSLPLKDRRCAHPAADAHGNHSILASPLPHLVQEGGGAPGASASQRVAKGDGPSVDVHPSQIKPELLARVEGLGGEGLVDLEQVDVRGLQAGSLDSLWDGNGGADSHDGGVDSNRAEGPEGSENWKPPALGLAPLHQQRGGGAVGDLRRVSGGGAPLGVEGRLQLLDLLERQALPHAVVVGDHHLLLLPGLLVHKLSAHGEDLVVEPSGLRGANGPSK
mmetsp:Transcript_8959/g.27159  ORF Transcript_8959/g.27159 Transcript_8959/m.27159 type:complete len:257 (-) Transcript_8959:856-1626(-)